MYCLATNGKKLTGTKSILQFERSTIKLVALYTLARLDDELNNA